MLKKALICFVLSVASVYAPAQAQTACGTVDQILETATLVRSIQADSRDRYFAANISRLEALSETISLASLISPAKNDPVAAETRALFSYLSIVREGVAGAQSGYNEYAKESLNSGITREFTTSIRALGEYWDCRPEDVDLQTELTRRNEQAVRAGKRSEKIERGEGKSNKSGSRVLMSAERANSGVLQKMRLDGGVIFKGDTLVFILMVAFIALALLVFFLQKRAKTYREREARRLLNKAVKVKLGKAQFTMHVVDISMSGAKIQHPGVIHKQGKVSVFLNGAWHAGQIKWNNKMFAGIKFKKPIDAKTVESALET